MKARMLGTNLMGALALVTLALLASLEPAQG